MFYALLLIVFVGPFWAFAVTAFSGITLQPGRLLMWPEMPTLENFHYAWVKSQVWRYLLELGHRRHHRHGAAGERQRDGGVRASPKKVPRRCRRVAAHPVHHDAAGGGHRHPLYIVLGKLPLLDISLLNTHAGMILPVVGWAFSIFMLTEFMKKVPLELEEAARVDGANEWQIFWVVILPLVKPALGSVAVFGFIMIWDQYLLPLIVANREDLYTLPVALATVRADETMPPAVFVAITLIAMAPSILIYLAMQKAFNRGLLMGGGEGMNCLLFSRDLPRATGGWL